MGKLAQFCRHRNDSAESNDTLGVEETASKRAPPLWVVISDEFQHYVVFEWTLIDE